MDSTIFQMILILGYLRMHTGIEVACLKVRKMKIQPGKLNLQINFFAYSYAMISCSNNYINITDNNITKNRFEKFKKRPLDGAQLTSSLTWIVTRLAHIVSREAFLKKIHTDLGPLMQINA